MNYAAYLIFAFLALVGFALLVRWLRRVVVTERLFRVLWTVVVAILLAGLGGTEWAVRRQQKEISAWLLGYATTYARETESLGHEQIGPDRTSDETGYANLIEAQKRWIAASPEVRNVYTLRQLSDGNITLNVVANAESNHQKIQSAQRIAIGAPYDGVLGPMIKRALTGESVVAPPYVDPWGVWVSALVPLHDSKRRVDAVLGVDFGAADWLTLERRAVLTAITITAAALLSVAAMALIGTQFRSLHVIAQQRAGLSTLEIEHAAIEEIVNSIDAIVWEWDVTARRFTFVSSQAEVILGYEVETWLADAELWRLLLHPDDRCADQHFDRLAEDGGPYHLEYRMIARDGCTVWIRETGLICRSVSADGHRLARGCMRDISAQKTAEAELEIAHCKVVENSRRAGMAEVATGVLHNVGNVLTSVNVSGNLIVDRVKHSRVSDLIRVAQMVREHRDSLPAFVTSDPRGQLLPDLLHAVAEQLTTEHGELLREVEQIGDRIGHIKDIVSVQQGHARTGGLVEPRNMALLIEDALKLNQHPLSRARVDIFRDYERKLPPVMMDSHRVLQILVNLVRNAVDSIEVVRPLRPRIVVRVKTAGLGTTVRVTVVDNGAGIAPEHMDRIFSHGFTTKHNGHGFGLHSGAIAAAEMGGSLTVISEGLGRGATFTLEIPIGSPNTEDPAFWQAAGNHIAA